MKVNKPKDDGIYFDPNWKLIPCPICKGIMTTNAILYCEKKGIPIACNHCRKGT
jgi:hypothetical protein